jgi:hypothetical protein
MGVDGSHCSFIILSLTSICWGVILPYALKRYCSMARANTRENPVMWFSSGFKKIGYLIAVTICCLIALSKLFAVVNSSNCLLCSAFVSSHCWGKTAAGRGGRWPGLGGLLYGVAVTVRYVAGVMIWPRWPCMPPLWDSTPDALVWHCLRMVLIAS